MIMIDSETKSDRPTKTALTGAETTAFGKVSESTAPTGEFAGLPAHLACASSVSTGTYSTKGRKFTNEDAHVCHIPDETLQATKGIAALVADGVSCSEGAQLASITAMTTFLEEYYASPDTWSVKHSVHKVMTDLNRKLYSFGSSYSPEAFGCVTTFSALILKSMTAFIFHIGDTRIYRYRDGTMEQLTRDHSNRVNENQTYLARALGLDSKADIDFKSLELARNDLFLLTSDGVHDWLSIEEMTEYMAQASTCVESGIGSLDDSVRKMCDQALGKGSIDNLTCVLARVDELPERSLKHLGNELCRLPFPPELSVGKSLDGYRVIQDIHCSARSQIYLVEDKTGGARFAMKTPSANYNDDPAYIERFILEPWTGKRFNHQNVMAVPDFLRPRSSLYYLMEWIDGQDLWGWMKQHPLPDVATIAPLVEQIFKGVWAMHSRDALHRDLKPDNIMIDKNSLVKIIDFGSSSVAGLEEISGPVQRDRILGTLNYSAPELLLGLQVDTRCDQFSLGCIIYEMLTGHLPYGDKISQTFKWRDFLALQYTPSYQHNPKIPLWFDAALKRAVSIRPEERYEATSQFYYDLNTPNPDYLRQFRKPLIERDPAAFWRNLAILFLVIEILTIIFFLHHLAYLQ